MNRDTFRQVINLLAVVATIVVNGLANALPLNGQLTGEISDQFKVYFVPAGYVFSIWGLIYVGLIAFGVYQMLPSQRENPRLRRIGYLFALSCLANIVWLFLWHYEFFIYTITIMVALLGLLIAIYLRLEIGRAQVPVKEKWLVDLPFSIYLGWITVATIANASDVLDYLKWSGWGIRPEVWAVIMLIAGVGIALAMSLTRGDIAYQLVIVWAFVGIAVKQTAMPVVANAAWVMSALVILVLIIGVLVRKQRIYQ
ncbi:MAG: tryptophan-rich sensory protein [Anaerolineales bacterium]|nr:tryptophan-rich sensory protein [Anaerolineales bacterium]